MADTSSNAAAPLVRDLYDLLTGDEDARVCRDIPDAACEEQPRNFFLQLVSVSLTKIGDGLVDPKLVLSWLLSALGAPAVWTGLLVPVRESLSLVPQLLVAGAIRRVPIRKWFWVFGSIGQGLALLCMIIAASQLRGNAAGLAIVSLLALFALFRGVASVASKDVLGKTVSKTRRGTVSGYAASASGLVTGAVGLALVLGDFGNVVGTVLVLLGCAAAMWGLGAVCYAWIAEVPGAVEGGASAWGELKRQLKTLRTDKTLRHFVASRGLLLSTALVSPFYVLLAQKQSSGAITQLGVLVIVSGMASALSAAVWGRLADRSSRLVMAAAGLASGTLAGFVFLTHAGGWSLENHIAFYPAVIFIMAVIHSGVRLGRKTYLVDMATIETRASYVALSNTAIGALLLCGGVFGLMADWVGVPPVIAILGGLSVAGAWLSFSLDETT